MDEKEKDEECRSLYRERGLKSKEKLEQFTEQTSLSV